MGCLVFFEAFADEYEAVRQSALGPRLPTWALQQVVSYPGYTGRDDNIVAKAACDPEETLPILERGLLTVYLSTRRNTVEK